MQNDETAKQDQEIQALLKDYPMPEATTAFYDQALVRATHEGTRRQRNRWLMTEVWYPAEDGDYTAENRTTDFFLDRQEEVEQALIDAGIDLPGNPAPE